ncbi:hypothetical protein Ade02nite_13250 [Paractinoplanes deccanensis]|uniref:Uncharacterized protein n=1 Tax=Paractinoplanes deccanensis TaxID=113561 RepID=A0ABQ3XY52_9ACTN|nr:hypothetical protein [Actinoplanes deccanensis]GID72684.1 hypothetical protein Ade02nite_13250 [Actinoplanes deccanensis]
MGPSKERLKRMAMSSGLAVAVVAAIATGMAATGDGDRRAEVPATVQVNRTGSAAVAGDSSGGGHAVTYVPVGGTTGCCP